MLCCALILSAWPAGTTPAFAAASEARAQPLRPAVALSPHIVELMFAAGAQAALTGVAQGSDYPPAAQTLPVIGDGNRPSPERLLSARPEVVLAWQKPPLRSLLPVLAAQHIEVIYSDPIRLDDIPQEIDHLGQVFGTQSIATPAAQALAARIAALRTRFAHARPVRVFIQVGNAPLYSVGEASIISDAVRLCGGINVMGATGLVAPRTSVEGVLASRPDAILTGVSSAQEAQSVRTFWRDQGWPRDDDTNARVITLPADALYRATPRLIDAAEALCHQLDTLRQG